MFAFAHSFTGGNLSAWNTSQVTDMSFMFNEASAFNGDVSGWDTSRVTSMDAMFQLAETFNGNVSAWNTSQSDRHIVSSHAYQNIRGHN